MLRVEDMRKVIPFGELVGDLCPCLTRIVGFIERTIVDDPPVSVTFVADGAQRCWDELPCHAGIERAECKGTGRRTDAGLPGKYASVRQEAYFGVPLRDRPACRGIARRWVGQLAQMPADGAVVGEVNVRWSPP